MIDLIFTPKQAHLQTEQGDTQAKSLQKSLLSQVRKTKNILTSQELKFRCNKSTQ